MLLGWAPAPLPAIPATQEVCTTQLVFQDWTARQRYHGSRGTVKAFREKRSKRVPNAVRWHTRLSVTY